MEKKGDFLERAEHLMKVDQFIKNDIKLDEEKKEHQKGVERYRDSLIATMWFHIWSDQVYSYLFSLYI